MTVASDSGPSPPALVVRGLSAGYEGRAVLHGIDFDLAPGTLTALIGPNGSGKTTLLHALAGVHREAQGEVLLGGRALRGMARREIARQVALVPQFVRIDFHVTVEDAVTLGRYPWLGPLAPLGPADQAAVAEALAALDLGPLRRRALQTLSGGERQRVFLARALAQATPLLLLDEPVASLDLRYQQETFERLQRMAAEQKVAVLVAEHHLNLVAATCAQLLVLEAGRLRLRGRPGEVIDAALIGEVFGARMDVRHDAHGRPQCLWRFEEQG